MTDVEKLAAEIIDPKSEAEVVMFTPELIERYWPMIARELDRVPQFWAIHQTKESIFEYVMEGKSQIWAAGPPEAYRLLLFTSIMNWPGSRILTIWLALGNGLDEFVGHLENSITKFCFERDIKYIEVYGRPGWERKLKGFKAKKVGTILRREIQQRVVN